MDHWARAGRRSTVRNHANDYKGELTINADLDESRKLVQGDEPPGCTPAARGFAPIDVDDAERGAR